MSASRLVCVIGNLIPPRSWLKSQAGHYLTVDYPHNTYVLRSNSFYCCCPTLLLQTALLCTPFFIHLTPYLCYVGALRLCTPYDIGLLASALPCCCSPTTSVTYGEFWCPSGCLNMLPTISRDFTSSSPTRKHRIDISKVLNLQSSTEEQGTALLGLLEAVPEPASKLAAFKIEVFGPWVEDSAHYSAARTYASNATMYVAVTPGIFPSSSRSGTQGSFPRRRSIAVPCIRVWKNAVS